MNWESLLSTKPRQLIYECLKNNGQNHVTVSDIVTMLQKIDKKLKGEISKTFA